jgi:hypothetical protein
MQRGTEIGASLLKPVNRAISGLRPGIMDTGDPMDKTVRKVTDLVEQQAETYRYWQSVSSSERMNATWEFTLEMYRMKGLAQDAQGLQRSVVRIQRA